MIPNLEQTFRWFGPSDAVTLRAITQTGATGIVTALHHIPCGEIWSDEEIKNRINTIEEAGLRWSVVESVNIHEEIKTGGPNRDRYIDNYITTLRNLGNAGIKVVCYNFMPVLDWTRTDLQFALPNGATVLRLDMVALPAFDIYLLEREGATEDYSTVVQADAKIYLDSLSNEQKKSLTDTILAGLPGTDEVFTIAQFREHLKKYSDVDANKLRDNLVYFLKSIIPHAQEAGIRMCIHPDDPPFPILGLPRVVCTESDLQYVVNACPSAYNGITFCTGSLGASPKNDLPGMVERLGKHIHFLHLRNVRREPNGSFYEAEHLDGSNDMYAIMRNIIHEQVMRAHITREDIAIPMRPDHGHMLLDDFRYNTYPGYSAIGRLKGLAELRGLEMGIKRSILNEQP
jgi:mannonate dehydratase